MEECSLDDALLPRTACIVTYGGDHTDIWINYLTLILVLAVAVGRAQHTVAVHIPQDKRSPWLGANAAALVGVSCFQIVLCWILGCAGISIIWCAVAGWIINERRVHVRPGDAGQPAEDRSRLDAAEDVTLTVVLVVLIYYAVTTAPITTVAHACALILGTLLSRMNRKLLLTTPSQVYESMTQ